MRSIRQNTEMEFDISYTNKEITPWGGMVFLKQMLQKTGFRQLVEQNTDLPQSGSNRGYKTSTIIEGFITSIWLRSGDTSSANNFPGFLEDTLSKLKNKKGSLNRTQ